MIHDPDPVRITPLANGGVRRGIADMLLGVALGWLAGSVLPVWKLLEVLR